MKQVIINFTFTALRIHNGGLSEDFVISKTLKEAEYIVLTVYSASLTNINLMQLTSQIIDQAIQKSHQDSSFSMVGDEFNMLPLRTLSCTKPGKIFCSGICDDDKPVELFKLLEYGCDPDKCAT